MQGERTSFVPWPPKLLTIDRYPKTNFQCHSSIHGPELLRHPWHHSRCYCRGAGILERKNYWQLYNIILWVHLPQLGRGNQESLQKGCFDSPPRQGTTAQVLACWKTGERVFSFWVQEFGHKFCWKHMKPSCRFTKIMPGRRWGQVQGMWCCSRNFDWRKDHTWGSDLGRENSGSVRAH